MGQVSEMHHATRKADLERDIAVPAAPSSATLGRLYALTVRCTGIVR